MAVIIQNLEESDDTGATRYRVLIAGKRGNRSLVDFAHDRNDGLAACLRAAADAIDAADQDRIAKPTLSLDDLSELQRMMQDRSSSEVTTMKEQGVSFIAPAGAGTLHRTSCAASMIERIVAVVCEQGIDTSPDIVLINDDLVEADLTAYHATGGLPKVSLPGPDDGLEEERAWVRAQLDERGGDDD